MNLLPVLYLVNARFVVFWQVVLQHITNHILCFFYFDPAQRAGIFVRVDGSLKIAAALIYIYIYIYIYMCVYIIYILSKYIFFCRSMSKSLSLTK